MKIKESKVAKHQLRDISEIGSADWRMDNSAEPFDAKGAQSYLAENIDRMAEGLLKSLSDD